jgi:threonine/homoserine/homoserine lactone efflux protein
MGIKMLGCLYFCILGARAIYKEFKAPKHVFIEQKKFRSDYKQGVLMNLLNPKVTLFFWLFFPGFLFSKSWSIVSQYIVLGSIFLLQATVIFSVVVFFSGQFQHFFSRFRFDFISGVLWIILGIYMVLP